MPGPTHEHGHTLDLVLSCGLPVTNLAICDSVLSDHMPVLFNVAFTHTAVKSRAAALHCRVINPSTATQFSVAFNQPCGPSDFVSSDTEDLNSWSYSCCQTILESVALDIISNSKTAGIATRTLPKRQKGNTLQILFLPTVITHLCYLKPLRLFLILH